MPLPGKGFLAIWNDVAKAEEAAWLKWHTVEHMPERVGVPGFLGGRRYIDWSRTQHRLFTLYLGERVETFSSPPYLERLNNPTPWTAALAPHFRNFLRGACRVAASRSRGLGGALTTVQVRVRNPHRASSSAAGLALVSELYGLDGIVGAHLGLQETGVSGVETREKVLRGDTPAIAFEGVVMIEALTRGELQSAGSRILSAINSAATGLEAGATGTYELSYSLDKTQL